LEEIVLESINTFANLIFNFFSFSFYYSYS